jgi:hypothetical protein
VRTHEVHRYQSLTCNGCHSSQETNTFFLQITPRFPGSEAKLSPFLTGTAVPDPVTGVSRRLGDLERRSIDLRAIVCNDAVAKAAIPAGGYYLVQLAGTTLRKGISRVH